MTAVTFVFRGKVGIGLRSSAEIQAPMSQNAISGGSIEPVSDINSGTDDETSVKAPIYGAYALNGEKFAGAADTKEWPIASLTKLMTALVERDVIQPTEKIKITPEMLQTDGTAGGFSEGEIFAAKDIEKALLMVSSNQAGEAFAQYYGRVKFIDTMNSYAYRIGMTDTHFEDPTGLSFRNQSTAEDLDRLVTYILTKSPDIFKPTRTASDRIYDYRRGRYRTLANINELAGKTGFIGGKTGTTPQAVGNLISIFSNDGGKSGRVIILLGSEDRYAETQNILDNILKWK